MYKKSKKSRKFRNSSNIPRVYEVTSKINPKTKYKTTKPEKKKSSKEEVFKIQQQEFTKLKDSGQYKKIFVGDRNFIKKSKNHDLYEMDKDKNFIRKLDIMDLGDIIGEWSKIVDNEHKKLSEFYIGVPRRCSHTDNDKLNGLCDVSCSNKITGKIHIPVYSNKEYIKIASTSNKTEEDLWKLFRIADKIEIKFTNDDIYYAYLIDISVKPYPHIINEYKSSEDCIKDITSYSKKSNLLIDSCYIITHNKFYQVLQIFDEQWKITI